jgi:hypothetical protein
MISWNNLAGRDCALSELPLQYFHEVTGEDDIALEIWTEHFLNTSLQHCRHMSLAGEKRFRLKEYSEMYHVTKQEVCLHTVNVITVWIWSFTLTEDTDNLAVGLVYEYIMRVVRDKLQCLFHIMLLFFST